MTETTPKGTYRPSSNFWHRSGGSAYEHDATEAPTGKSTPVDRQSQETPENPENSAM